MIIHLSKLLLLGALILGLAVPAMSAEVRFQQGSSAVTVASGISGDGCDAVPTLFADSVSISKWFWGAGGRTRVVQLCVVTMCIALFIMMRKLN